VDPKFQLSISEEVSQSRLAQVLTDCVFSCGSCGLGLWRNDLDGVFSSNWLCGTDCAAKVKT